MNRRICIVAILKNEDLFLDEWLLYHRLIGVDYFFLYDDSVDGHLKNSLLAYHPYVTTIEWRGLDKEMPGRNKQTRAYTHAVDNLIEEFEWVAFIDGDEFIVLPHWQDNIQLFLDDFDYAASVSLNWHVFGHNGHYEFKNGLVTELFTRRMRLPSPNIKSITRTKNILKIHSAHFCRLNGGEWMNPEHKKYNELVFDENSLPRAHINHYQCRSFKHWMSRLERGDVSLECGPVSAEQQWRYDENLLLRKFVENIALDKNEYVDEYMLKFSMELNRLISNLKKK